MSLTLKMIPDEDLHIVERGVKFTLQNDFHFILNDTTITIPKGFVTDFASVPRIFWNIIPPIGSYSKAAVIHDFLCEINHYSRGRWDDLLNKPEILSSNYKEHQFLADITRKEVDKLFLDAMSELKVKPIKKHVIYFFVSLYRLVKRVK